MSEPRHQKEGKEMGEPSPELLRAFDVLLPKPIDELDRRREIAARKQANEAGGQPPSDGLPSEPSEEAVKAAIREMNCGWSIPEMAKRALRAAYAAERGVSAVTPTEEPNE